MNFDNGQQDYNRHYTSQVWGGGRNLLAEYHL